jgi:hypothetical protein
LFSAYSAFINVYCGTEEDYLNTGGWTDHNSTDGITVNGSEYLKVYSHENIADYRIYHELVESLLGFGGVFDGAGSMPLSDIYQKSVIKDYSSRVNLLSSIVNTANGALAGAGYRQIINAMWVSGAGVESINWDPATWAGHGTGHPAAPAYYIGKLSFQASTPERPQYVVITFGIKYEGGDDTELTEIVSTEVVTLHSTAKQLQGVITKWYFILRNIAILVLMLVLIYSGIRIVIGSTAGEKAKYKERLKDWLVAICLVFIMHYIMVFAVEIVERITGLVRSSAGLNANAAVIELTDTQKTNAQEIIQNSEYDISNIGALDGSTLTWKTDLAGLFRIQSQMVGEGTAKWVGFSLCYLVLVLFTLFFAWTYLKRVLYMAFLTMIAPLVAMTYPIDKITDGKAQAFDAWLKEYIFNLMIQPLHLLLYAILVSSAFELATSSPLYALVAVGFMMPAEKLMRRFFGFEKAKTPGLLGGAAGAALAMSGMQSLLKPKPNSGKHDGGASKDQSKVKFANKNNIDTMGAVAGGAAPTLGAGRGGSSGGSSSDRGGTNPNPGGGTNPNPGVGPNPNPGENTEEEPLYYSGLRERLDELNAEGFGPGDPEYDRAFRNFGLDPNDSETLRQFGINTSDSEEEGRDTETPLDSEAPENPPAENIPLISTFAQTNAARAAYNRPQHRSFDEERAANIARERQKRRQRIKGATGAVLSSTGRQLAGKVLTGVHPLKWAGQLALGATAATAGLLFGVASGDASKAFQYTTAGAVAGNAMAKSLSGRQVLDAQQLKEEAQIGYYGEDYKNKVIEDQRKAFQRDISNINYLRKTMGVGKDEAKEILATTGGQCFDNGITSIEDIATIHKLTNGDDRMSFNQAVAARNYAKKRLPSDPDQMTEDTKSQYIARWEREYDLAGYADANGLAKKSFDLAIRFNKAQSGLTKNP